MEIQEIMRRENLEIVSTNSGFRVIALVDNYVSKREGFLQKHLYLVSFKEMLERDKTT